jgi:HAE1 family hydrophobic/amphiphilic exporter-1
VNLSKIFILRPVMTILVMFAIVIWGGASFFLLPVSALPDVDYPVITVSVPFPGTNPKTMANTVATPLEQQFMTIPGIKNIFSNNILGKTTIILEFEIDINIDLAAVDVEAAIVKAQGMLPPNLPQQPSFKKVNPSASPIIHLTATSEAMTLGELYDYAFTVVGQRLSIIEGVAQVNAYGSPMAIRAQIDPGQIASMGLTSSDISTAISNQNQYQPLGQFDGKYSSSIIYDNGGLYNEEDYKNIIVRYQDASNVRLEDVGVVLNSIELDRSQRRFVTKTSDQPTVVLAISKQAGANTLEISKNVNKTLEALREELPSSFTISNVFDKSKPIVESVHEVEMTLIVAFLLVVFVIFIYLGKIKDTINPALSMPISIIATFAMMYVMNYSIDNLSLLALILATGFIIDDAIVVLENIERRVELGEDSLTAALNGSKQISTTILSMTLSLAAVFIPLLFMPGLIGKLFHEFAVILMTVTLWSGIISLTLNPMLCARFVQKKSKNSKVSIWSKQLNEWMSRVYQRPLKWILKKPWVAIMAASLSVILSVILLLKLPANFLPVEDLAAVILYTEADQSTSSTQMNEYHSQIYKKLINLSYVANITSISANPTYFQGLLYVRLTDKKMRVGIEKVMEELRGYLEEIVGVNTYLKAVPLIDLNIGNQIRGDYQYLIQSLKDEDLFESSTALLEKLRNDSDFSSVSSDLEIKTPQVNLLIQRDLASTLGVNVYDIEQALNLGFSGNWITRIQTPVNQYDVIIELLRNLQDNPSSLSSIYVPSRTTNSLVPLSALVKLSESVGPSSVNHFNQFPAVTITFNINPKVTLSDALEKLNKYSQDSLLPGVEGLLKGSAEAFKQTYEGAIVLLILAVVAIYIILGILYESFIQPLTILTTLPPAIFGGVFVLWLLNEPFSLYGFLGLILLIGIIKKNGIMIVDFALDNIREKGETAENSIYDACLVRLRPIMMTTVAAIFGALPLVFADDSGRRSLGYVIIGGLVISQFVTLFVTPSMYLVFEKLRETSFRRTHTKMYF